MPDTEPGLAWRLGQVEKRLEVAEAALTELPVIKNELRHLTEGMEELGRALKSNTDSNTSLRNSLLVAALALASSAIVFALTITFG